MAPADKPSPDENPNERRRRSRLSGETTGWVIPESGPANEPWEVRVENVSRVGVGFESAEQFGEGQTMRIRIGRGPLELTKRIKIVRCHPGKHAGTYTIGGEFV